MSSNQWEVVTKSKKQRNLEKKVEAHTEKKRLALAGPSLEEILPQHQLKSIFSSKSSKDKENKSPKKTTNNSNKSSPAKKSKSNNNNNESNKKSSTPAAPPAPPRPKNLETALLKITPDELNGLMEQLRTSFPGNELYWLREIASFFNSHLPFDCDPTFSGKAILYPSNVVPKNLKTAIIDIFKTMGDVNLSYFYDTLITRMTEELSKNKSVVGYKLLLQIVAQNWPTVCSNSLAKTAILRNSYQNRSNIGLSILWGVGQGGFRDINVGVKVWQNIMLPVIEMKSYSRYVSDYIEKVLSSGTGNQKLLMSQSDFFILYNALKAKYSIPRECQLVLTKSSQLFLKKYIESSSKHANVFLNLFRDIENSTKNQVEIDGCIDCLTIGDECFKIWKMNYKKNVLPSYLLLQHIYQQWDGSAVKLRDSKAFEDFLLVATQLNLELEAAKKRDPHLDELLSLFGNVQDKSTQQKKKTAAGKSSCGCKWFLGSIVLLAVIAGVLHYDTSINGKGVFANSATGKLLKKGGLLPHVEKAYVVVMTNTARGYKWAEQRVPGYMAPVGQLACDMFKLARNTACSICGMIKDYSVAKWPAVSAALESYIPGLPKKLENATVSTRVLISDSLGKITEFFKLNVFVGTLSPENLGKVFNQTQVAAIKYANEFSQQMDAWAKRK
ncbi:transmembrane protein 214 [Eupeodes corollae]|uniref:transmembrane protein 214 n=1 Tax=Eupeodes corollae TaxID=290404 RepID=UPI002492CE27|nr:transmembrane protein 214 [Eupeodes corollae]